MRLCHDLSALALGLSDGEVADLASLYIKLKALDHARQALGSHLEPFDPGFI